MFVESLEERRLFAVTLDPNPGHPQAANSHNAVAIAASSTIGNGKVVSELAQSAPGARAAAVQKLLGHTHPDKGGGHT